MELPHLTGWAALAVTVGTVVFRAGYRLGREAESRQSQEKAKERESAFCFRGLNFLLADEPDKAIEEFIKVVRIHSETVEIHLSLGSLFRSRGEVGRAIRIHQNIIARPNLSDANRTAALFALAEDYRQGGFFDRAVDAFRRVLSVDPDHQKALAGLQALHENEGRWDMALTVLRQLNQVTAKQDPRREAHLLLQLGQESMGHPGAHALDVAMEHFREAIKIFPGCVEAYRLLGEAQLARGEAQAAIQSFVIVQKTRPSHFFMLVDALRRAYARLGDEEGFERCMAAAVGAPVVSPRLVVLWSRLLADKQRFTEALAVLQKGFAHYPGSVGITRSLASLHAQLGQHDEVVAVVDRCLEHLMSRQPAFQCSRCGFTAQDIYWKCPQCRQWDTLEPLW